MKIRPYYILAIVLTAILSIGIPLFSIGCNKKPATAVDTATPVLSKGDQIIHDAKVYGPTLAALLEEAIKQEALYAQSGVIDAALEPGIRLGLANAKKIVIAFNARAAKWSHFDATNKEDIQALLEDALDFVEQIYNDGVLQIKNPQSQQIAAGILSSAKVTLVLWQSSFQQAQQ